MTSIILDSVKDNTFIPYPDISFSQGTSNGKCFNDVASIIRKYTSIKDLQKNLPYTEWKYCGKDTEETFSLNSKLSDDNWYYKNNSVVYTLNSFGYRTKNFNEIDWENAIVIFGCSNVQGVGVTDEHTVSYFLEKEMNMPVVNMGVGGASNDFHIHNSTVLLSQYPKPKAVLCSVAGLQRYPFYHWNYVEHRGDWTDNKAQSLINRSNNIVQNIMSFNIINNIWKSKTTYIEYCTDHMVYNFLEDVNPQQNRFHLDPGWPNIEYNCRGTLEAEFARDFAHPGKDYHRGLAKLLAELLKSRMN